MAQSLEVGVIQPAVEGFLDLNHFIGIGRILNTLLADLQMAHAIALQDLIDFVDSYPVLM